MGTRYCNRHLPHWSGLSDYVPSWLVRVPEANGLQQIGPSLIIDPHGLSRSSKAKKADYARLPQDYGVIESRDG